MDTPARDAPPENLGVQPTLEAPAIGAEVAPDRTLSFGRYALRERLAKGGMAAVYLAQTRGPDGFRKWVAIKTILPTLSDREDFVAMFLDEARLAARLSHPNVCSVFDFGEEQGTYYLAMEFLQGAPLSRLAVALRKRRESLEPALAARIVADAARGLHAAHELRAGDGRSAEVVHRDVSPQNIFVLFDGIAKVVDFGIARSRDRLAEDTRTGLTKGKPAYMSPEQLRGDVVDRRTDVFALGVVLWEISVGARLFRRDSDVATMYALLNEPIPDPRESVPAYPPALAAIVMRALARDVDARFQTADELARALDDYIASTGRPAGAAQLADLMQHLFGAEITDRQSQLARWDRDTLATEVSVSSGSSQGVVRAPLPSAFPPAATPAHLASTSTQARTRVVVIALALVALASLAAAGAFALHRSTAPAMSAPAAALATAPRASASSSPPAGTASASSAAPTPSAEPSTSAARLPVVATSASHRPSAATARPRGSASAPEAPAATRAPARPRATGLMHDYE